MRCKCDDKKHGSLGTTLWHRAYCNWYDADRSGRRRRATAWGAIADRLARFA